MPAGIGKSGCKKFTWNADNTPNLGAPVNPNAPIALSSGEAPHIRYEGEEGVFGGTARAAASPNGSGGAKAGYIDTPDSFAEYTVHVPSAGEYILLARTANGTAGGGWSHLLLSINGGPSSQFHITNKAGRIGPCPLPGFT